VHLSFHVRLEGKRKSLYQNVKSMKKNVFCTSEMVGRSRLWWDNNTVSLGFYHTNFSE